MFYCLLERPAIYSCTTGGSSRTNNDNGHLQDIVNKDAGNSSSVNNMLFNTGYEYINNGRVIVSTVDLRSVDTFDKSHLKAIVDCYRRVPLPRRARLIAGYFYYLRNVHTNESRVWYPSSNSYFLNAVFTNIAGVTNAINNLNPSDIIANLVAYTGDHSSYTFDGLAALRCEARTV